MAMVKIRKFRSGDEASIQALISGIMNNEFPQSKSAFPMDDLRNISDVYGSLGEAFFVATTNGQEIVGTIAIKREDERIALLRRVFVDPVFRNQKIGLRLIDQAIDFCKEVGYHEIVFKTSSKMDGAIRLCQKKNFHQRAKLEIGGLELLKFVLLINGGAA